MYNDKYGEKNRRKLTVLSNSAEKLKYKNAYLWKMLQLISFEGLSFFYDNVHERSKKKYWSMQNINTDIAIKTIICKYCVNICKYCILIGNQNNNDFATNL